MIGNKIVGTVITLRRVLWMQLIVVYLRYLLGLAFIIPAVYMGKLSNKGSMFTDAGANEVSKIGPFGQFWSVMSNSGLYWNFLGWFQVISGVLLVTQRFAKLGALFFFGMMLNIFFITLSFHFEGTPMITGLMTLAALSLLVWDITSLRYLFFKPGTHNFIPEPPLKLGEDAFWVATGILLIVVVFLLIFFKMVVLSFVVPFLLGIVAVPVYYLLRKGKSLKQ